MKTAGAAAEQLASAYLQRQGLQFLAANYRCRFGEIDLVMRDGKQTVFVEVGRRRRRTGCGAAARLNNAKKPKQNRTPGQ